MADKKNKINLVTKELSKIIEEIANSDNPVKRHMKAAEAHLTLIELFTLLS